MVASRHNLFRVFYGFGFTPWDGHAHTKALRELIEGTADTPALPPAAALDVGCGTGDSSVYLAQHGWHVTGVDFVPKALGKAPLAEREWRNQTGRPMSALEYYGHDADAPSTSLSTPASPASPA